MFSLCQNKISEYFLNVSKVLTKVNTIEGKEEHKRHLNFRQIYRNMRQK